MSAHVRTCLHMSAYIRTCPHMSAHVRTCPHMSAHVRTCPNMSAHVCTLLQVRMCGNFGYFYERVRCRAGQCSAEIQESMSSIHTLNHRKMCQITKFPAISQQKMPKNRSMQIHWWPAALDSEMPLSDWRMMRARELRPYGTNKISSNIACMFGWSWSSLFDAFPRWWCSAAVLQCTETRPCSKFVIRPNDHVSKLHTRQTAASR